MLDRVFGALADPTRRGILAHLAKGDRCAGDLAKPYAMSLPAISQHLRVLEKAGLIRRSRRGRVHQLRLEASRLKKAEAWIEGHRRTWERRLDQLDEYLKELQSKENQHEPKE
jgi:DNA-binding transcriptional ArsR family regulator